MTLKTTVSSLALVAFGAPALAEMDATTLWGEWTAIAAQELPGLSITAAQTVETETEVRLTDVVIRLEDGNDIVEARVPGFALTETPEGGLMGTFTGNATVLALPDGGVERGNRVTADLTVDGLSLSFAQNDVMTVRLEAPLLGAVLTEITVEGEAQPLEAAFSIAGLSLGVSDTGENGADRRAELDFAARDLTLNISAQDMEDVAELDVQYDIASIDLEAMLDAPLPLFWGSERFDGDIDSMLRLSVGPGTISGLFEEEPYDEGDVSRFSMSVGFDGIKVDHAAYVPAGLEAYPNGQDLIPDDLVGHFEYEVTNVRGQFSGQDGYSYDGSVSSFMTDGLLTPSDARARFEISDAGNVEIAANVTTGFAFEAEDSYVSGEYEDVEAVNMFARNLSYAVQVSAPIDNAMMLYMQGLPEGLSYQVSASVDEAGMLYNETSKDGEFPPQTVLFDGSVAGTAVDVTISDQDLSLSVASERLDGAFQEFMPEPLGVEADGLFLAYDLPINTGTGTRPYSFVLNVGAFTMDDGLWDIALPGIALDRGPMSIAATAGGEMRASTNPMAFMGIGMGMNPISVETLVFELAAAAVGATVQAVGAFDTSEMMMSNTPPVGTADVTTTGLEELLNALSGSGLFSEAEIAEALFLLNAFTEVQPGGERTMRVEINDQEHLIVNGVRMQ